MLSGIKLNGEWKEVLEAEFSKPYFEKLSEFLENEYAQTTVYPKKQDVFRAFNETPFSKVRVVIIGQDPYHGPNQANGLSFSVHPDIKIPPSLANIFKEVKAEMFDFNLKNGDLEPWAKQGIFLLNATLTVGAGKPGSHQNKGWEQFTDAVIRALSTKRQDLVYLLWGSFAQKKGALIPEDKNLILKSVHPSPLSAYRGFAGNGHFTQTNKYLITKGESPINW